MGASVKARARATVFGLVLFGAIAGCSREHHYESVCQIVRKEAVELDKDGKPATIDMELEWDPCPGDQFQVIRGNKDFAACVEKYDVGDLVPVVAKQWWDPRGFFRWDIEKLGDCKHTIEPEAMGSYEKSQDCSDTVNHGHTAGFTCSRRPFHDLLKRCPWMARD